MVDSTRPSAPVTHADPAEHRRQIANVVNLINQSTPDYRRTPAEITAGVTPVNLRYPTHPFVDPRRYGAKFDGTTDDTTAIRQALDFGPVLLPAGVIGIDNLQLKSGDVLLGSGAKFWQQSANKPTGTDVTILKYVGAGGANSVCVRASAKAVGTRPVFQSDGSEDTFGWTLKNLIIDGDDTAEHGLYGARCGLSTLIENVICTGCEEHGAWLGEFWTAKIVSLYGIWNGGCGITLGKNTFSWAANSVNGLDIGLLQAFANDQDGNFDEDDAIDAGYGIGWCVGRAVYCASVIVESNEGPGLYVQTGSGPSRIENLYTEGNGSQAVTDSRATEEYGVLFDSAANSVTFSIGQIHKSGSADQYLWLTGTEPGTGPREGFVLNAAFGGLKIKSEWSNYRLGSEVQVTTARAVEGNWPQNNDADSITPNPSVTTLYVDDAESGTGSGRDTSNYMTFSDAIELAKILTTVTTIDVSAMTTATANVTLDGADLTRRLTIDGGTTGRFTASSGVGPTFKNFWAELTIDGMAAMEFVSVQDGRVRINDCPVIRMDTGSTAGYALSVDNADVQICGTSVINVSGSSASVKAGLRVQGGGSVIFANAGAGTITGHTTDDAITFAEGAGTVRISADSATAAWALSITYDTDGEAGEVILTDAVILGGGTLALGGANITDAETSHAVTDFATTNTALDALGTKLNEALTRLEEAGISLTS